MKKKRVITKKVVNNGYNTDILYHYNENGFLYGVEKFDHAKNMCVFSEFAKVDDYGIYTDSIVKIFALPFNESKTVPVKYVFDKTIGRYIMKAYGREYRFCNSLFYNKNGLLDMVTRGDQSADRYVYDEKGRLIKSKDSNNIIKYTYDDPNYMIYKDYCDFNGNIRSQKKFVVDEDGRVLSCNGIPYVYDRNGNLIESFEFDEIHEKHEYDSDNNRIQTTLYLNDTILRTTSYEYGEVEASDMIAPELDETSPESKLLMFKYPDNRMIANIYA